MSKTEVQQLRGIRQYLLISLALLLTGGIALLAYSKESGLTIYFWAIILLSLLIDAALIYQVYIIKLDTIRRLDAEYMLQSVTAKKEELEKELQQLLADRELGKAEKRNREEQLTDLIAELQGDSLQAYLDSYFKIVGTKWELMQAVLYRRQDDNHFRPIAHYAYFSNDPELEFVSGETILGQVVKEGKPLYVDNVESESIMVVSGSGSSKPCNLFFVPLCPSLPTGDCSAIVELAFMKQLGENDRDMLIKFTESMATHLEKKA